MLALETLRTAWRALGSNKLRTALTTLGMIIGVAAVVSMLAIGEGARASVEGQIRSLGANLLTVRPGAPMRGPVKMGRVETLTLDDAKAIARLPDVAAVAPESSESAQVEYLSNNMTSSIVGTTPDYLGVRSFELALGSSFTDYDMQGRRRVALIGSNVAETLFGEAQAVGQRMQIRGMAFTVVGVLAEKGDSGFSSPDDQVLVPITTFQGSLFGTDHLSSLSVQVASEEAMDGVQASIEQLLRIRHRLGAGAADDFNVRSQSEMLETMGEVTGTFTALLGGVAAVSLLVGGIGIMNIMLVSVRERTREIGVRIAVGAQRRDVLMQFLIEAVIVSLAGGVAGLVIGWVGANVISLIGGWETVVPLYAVALALVTSLVIGVVFGVGPARRAARLDPVEALRHE
jgi:putative ABC transport system permease protein